MVSKILCYYHGVDNDGFFSGGLVKYFSQIMYPNAEITLKPWTYSRDEPKLSKLIGYDQLYLVDLHWSNELMYTLFEHYHQDFIWIDHHISSIDEFYNWFHNPENMEVNKHLAFANDDYRKPVHLTGIQSCEYSACRNVYRYFKYLIPTEDCPLFKLAESRKNEMSIPLKYGLAPNDYKIPLWLYFVSTYDNWMRSEDREFWDTYLLNYEQWARNKFHNAEEAYYYIDWWLKTFRDFNIILYNNDEVNKNIESGKFLLDYQQEKDDRDARISGWTQTVKTDDGREYKAFLLNTQRRGSAIFKNIKDVNTYDLFIPFYRDKEKWNYSCYSFKDDMYIPGLYFKGVKFNGHAKASGCQSKEFLFDSEI